jgi:predicted amidohydrolase
MKAQAAQHNIHLVGTLLLLDETDIYNTALLVAPDGRTWRYEK